MTQIVRANPKFGPILLGKYDLADGYYRVPLNVAQAMRLACLFPKSPGEEPLVAIPLGWTESSPYFCSVTETIVDITNVTLDEAPKHPSLRLEHLVTYPNDRTTTNQTRPKPHHIHNHVYNTPLSYTDVYIDDIIGIYQLGSMPAKSFHSTHFPQHRPRLPIAGTTRSNTSQQTNFHQKAERRWRPINSQSNSGMDHRHNPCYHRTNRTETPQSPGITTRPTTLEETNFQQDEFPPRHGNRYWVNYGPWHTAHPVCLSFPPMNFSHISIPCSHSPLLG
jgi:hypothetical protein